MPQAPSYYDWGGRPTKDITPSVDFSPLARSQPNLQNLAKGIDNLGNSLSDIQAKDHEETLRTNLAAADTQNADIQRKLLNDPEHGFFNLRGKDAMDAYDGVIKSLMDAYAQNGAAFEGDKSASADYQNMANRRLNAALGSVDNYVSAQKRDWMDGTSKARIESATNDAVANYTDPKSVNLSLAIGRGEILDMGDRNGWSKDETDAAIREFESGTQRSIISRIATDNPTAAASYFNRVKDGLTAQDAVSSDGVIKQADARAKYEHSQAQGEFESDLLINLRRGNADYSDIENAYKAGNISPSFRASATVWLDDNLVKNQQKAAEMQRVDAAGAGGAPLDPTSSDDKKALNAHFEQVASSWVNMKPDEVMDRTIAYTVQKGIVPERLKSVINGGLRGGTPDQQVLAAEALQKLRTANPELIKDFNAEAISRGNLIDQYVSYGMKPEDAVVKVDELSRVDKNVADARAKEYAKEATADYKAGSASPIDVAKINLSNAFDQGLFYATPEAETAVAAEYNQVAKDEFLKSGNLQAAQKTALDTVQRQWGVTRVGSEPRLMKLAPEKFYSVPELDPVQNADWMQKQLESDVQGAGGLFNSSANGRLSLTPSPTVTAKDGLPTYSVVLDGEDGIPRVITDPTGKPLVWRPDFASSEKAKEIAAEQKRKLDEARTARGNRDLPIGAAR